MKNSLRSTAIVYLRYQEKQLAQKLRSWSYTGRCPGQHGGEMEEHDICPCEARGWYELDRIAESMDRLVEKKTTLWKWLFWYLRSSSKLPYLPCSQLYPTEIVAAWNPFFPKKCFEGVYHQEDLSSTPYRRYHIRKTYKDRSLPFPHPT